MTDYTDIIDRLEKADGPSRELNLAIFRLFHPEYDGYVEGRGGLVHPNDSTDMRELSNVRWPAYTASLDAAVALVERMLPGWAKGVDDGPETHLAFVDTNDYSVRMFGARHTAEASTASIALLIAMFKALQAQEIAETDSTDEAGA